MKNLQGMIDNEFEVVINDMGLAPIVASMTEVLGIPEMINEFVGVQDCRKKVDVGTAIKALVINMLYGRTPLVHVERTFEHLDCGVIFGEGLIAADFNDDCLGNALEEIGSLDFHKLYSKISMRALELHSVTADKIHVDTTNVSVYGDYDSSEAPDFGVTYGDPKSKRKDLKQFNIGLFVQQNGLPIGGNALSGNKSDITWFREALEELHESFSGDIYTRPISIFDAAGSNEEMYKKANNLQVPAIIRQSDRFKMTGEYIDKAWEESIWSIVDRNGKEGEIGHGEEYYKLRSFDVNFEGYDWRLIVAYSSALQKLKENTAERNFNKNRETMIKMAKKLSGRAFKTYVEAEQEGNNFINKNIGVSRPFKYSMDVEERKTEKYAKRGKPIKSSEKTVEIKYYIKIEIGERDDELYQKWLKQESCFVLVSNVPKDRKNSEELFSEYKAQWKVEEKFKFLKQPVILGSIWLQRQERIKGLIFVLLLAVLVNMYICYRFMANLPKYTKEESRDSKKQCAQTSSLDIPMIVKEDINCINFEDEQDIENVSIFDTYENIYKLNLQKYMRRPIKNITFKILQACLSPIKTIIKINQEGEAIRKFAHRTEHILLETVIKVGFDPSIYLEKFTSKMDLWEYNFT